MSADAVQRAVEHLHADEFHPTAYRRLDPARLNEWVQNSGLDRRYRMHLLAATTDYRSGIIRWHGTRYHFNVSPAGVVTVERAS